MRSSADLNLKVKRGISAVDPVCSHSLHLTSFHFTKFPESVGKKRIKKYI
jgi:hypothetical protein